MPGGCCYGNASAIAMIGHSCLINWFFNASWFVRTLKEQVHSKWKINGFLFPSLFPFFLLFPPAFLLLILLKLFSHVSRSGGVLNYYWKLSIAVDGGRLELGYLKCKRNVFVHVCLLCAAAEANTESNVVWILWVFKAGQSLILHYFVVHFYSSNLLGPIMIREPSLHLWTSARVYQDFICFSIWSF